jgi:hypothetical protein
MAVDPNTISASHGKILLLLALILLLSSGAGAGRSLSDAEISTEMKKDANRAIIEEFLKAELREVNKYVTQPLLNKHPSLIFFINQVDRGPLESLFFLEKWVHTLLDAQKNIDSFPYSITFSGSEKKKILELRPVTERIISYGIPVMKRDFYRVIVAAKDLAKKRNRDPLALIPNVQFRNAIYRHAESNVVKFTEEMGELSHGELVCMRLGWVLEQVTVTSIWLKVTNNDLPRPDDYMVYRKKRSEYFETRVTQIYGEGGQDRAGASRTNR